MRRTLVRVYIRIVVDNPIDANFPYALSSLIFSVRGYPTIKYWVNGVESDYQSGRDYESLSKFVDETLQRACDIEDSEGTCDERAVKYIAKMKDKGEGAVNKELER